MLELLTWTSTHMQKQTSFPSRGLQIIKYSNSLDSIYIVLHIRRYLEMTYSVWRNRGHRMDQQAKTLATSLDTRVQILESSRLRRKIIFWKPSSELHMYKHKYNARTHAHTHVHSEKLYLWENMYVLYANTMTLYIRNLVTTKRPGANLHGYQKMRRHTFSSNPICQHIKKK